MGKKVTGLPKKGTPIPTQSGTDRTLYISWTPPKRPLMLTTTRPFGLIRQVTLPPELVRILPGFLIGALILFRNIMGA